MYGHPYAVNEWARLHNDAYKRAVRRECWIVGGLCVLVLSAAGAVAWFIP